MFGKNKVNQEAIENLKNKVELDDHFFARMERDRDMFSAGMEEIDESYRQVEVNVNQARDNMGDAAALAEENSRVEAELIRSMNEYGERAAQTEERYAALCGEIRKLFDEAAGLVEENKHFTSPSKYLSECPAGFRSQNMSFTESLNELADCSKQMGVLALGAAIEAGRMGDAGMQFVKAAEEIRTLASAYDKAILGARAKLEQSDRRIAELEEQVRHVVKLLRENNVSTAKLMKSCDALAKRAEREKVSGLSTEAAAFRNQVMILKNADEEIIKSEERNRMQMDDLNSEFAAQQKNQRELLELMEPVFRHAVERRAAQEPAEEQG